MKFYVESTFKSLGMLVTGQLSKDDVSGPVGLVKVVDEVYDSAKVYGAIDVLLNMMEIALLLSVNLGIMNLLPFPALDGGRLVFAGRGIQRQAHTAGEGRNGAFSGNDGIDGADGVGVL